MWYRRCISPMWHRTTFSSLLILFNLHPPPATTANGSSVDALRATAPWPRRWPQGLGCAVRRRRQTLQLLRVCGEEREREEETAVGGCRFAETRGAGRTTRARARRSARTTHLFRVLRHYSCALGESRPARAVGRVKRSVAVGGPRARTTGKKERARWARGSNAGRETHLKDVP